MIVIRLKSDHCLPLSVTADVDDEEHVHYSLKILNLNLGLKFGLSLVEVMKVNFDKLSA